MLFCPCCQTPLVAVEFQEVELDYCPRCKGCWFDRNELALLLHGDPAAGVEVALLDRQRGQRPCPRCGDRMDTGLGARIGRPLDQCRHGHGWWLDAGELRALIDTTASRPDLARLSTFCDRVLGAAMTGKP